MQRASSGSPFEPTIGFSRAVRIDDRVLVAGTGPVWPSGECSEDVGVQAQRCFEIALTAAAELGATASDVVRTRMYLTDAAYGEAVGAVHGALFGEVRPAATMIVVAGFLDARWKVEIELEAAVST